ncbi:unnamed protein product [Larinioides sclopetarius]|uniref:Speckle-type POZ protein n=1 Tax=Larinioides sclopetarius TaxID=280406 RepID=A0AAV1YX02_9ARAC
MAERKSTTITWKIKNFSFCWQKNEGELCGPTFVIEGLQNSKWTLLLFPRASRSKEEGSIACYLYHKKEDTETHEVEIDYELSALGCDGQPLETVSFPKCTMQGNDWSSPLLLRKKIVFIEKRDEFLPNDSLRIRCRIRQVNQENINTERYFATTRIEVEKFSLLGVLIGRIDDLKSHEKIYSVEFISSSGTPLILLNFKIDEEGQFYAKIKQANPELMKFCKCKLNFTDKRGKKIAYGQDEFLFPHDTIPLYHGAPVWIFPLTFTEQKYTRKSNLSRMIDNLKLHCEISYSAGIVTEKMKKVDYSINTFQNGCCFKEKRQEYLPTLKDDLISLMTNADNRDIKLRTENKTFPAHSIILSARSLFFRNELNHKSKRKTIYINDLDNETLYQMLVFLYTDTIENLEPKSAVKLYIASERFGIPSLKYICSCFLQNNLDTSICCNVLQAADQYQDNDLKKAALRYILEHADEVIGSDMWQDLKYFTELTEEVLYLKSIKS